MRETKHINKDLYEQALLSRPSVLLRLGRAAWLVIGLSLLGWMAWAEPFSSRVLNAETPVDRLIIQPVVMLLRAVLLVESVGYAYHRFFQHVGFLTRRAQFIRTSQRYHWWHHMLLYPLGKFYKRNHSYIPAEKGALSWWVPGVFLAGLFLLTHGVTLASVTFIVGIWAYAKLVVDTTHSLFHVEHHRWSQSIYFKWLESIHLLHHWDQYSNFTIVHPAMDVLFGTYRSPRNHKMELATVVDHDALTLSDIINWRYMLLEASPAEYAAFISKAKNNHAPRTIRKLNQLRLVLETRTQSHPTDEAAQDLLGRLDRVLALVRRNRQPSVQGTIEG